MVDISSELYSDRSHAGTQYSHPGPGASPKSDRVFGQPDYASNDANRGGAVGPDTLNFPLGLVIDSKGGFYVADRGNNRVLYFGSIGDTKATHVYGQYGNFTTNVKNNDGKGGSGTPSADNLNLPVAVALDIKGGLFVVDRDNHRVMHFPAGSTTADHVYGQFGSITSGLLNNDGKGGSGGPNAENLGLFALGVTVDSKDGVYVSDSMNNRVLYFANDGSTKAIRVYGQFGNFNSAVKNNDGKGVLGLPNANSLNFPRGLALDSKGGLFVADRDNHRVLHFPAGSTTPDRVYGQTGSFTTGVLNNNGQGDTGSGAATADNLFNPRGLSIDSGDGLYVADSGNSRVLYFANDGNTTADRVYGQYGQFTMNAVNNDGKNVSKLPSAGNLAGAQYISVGANGRLYVSDTNNNRVLVFEKSP